MKQVDELIRGELAAIRSIDAILNKVDDEMEKTKLSSIRIDHVNAVDTLKRYAGSDVQVDENSSGGPWAAVASAFTGGASLFGDKAALNALKVGEQHGFNEYQEAIQDGDTDPALKTMIQTELIPNQEKHLQIIDQYLQ